MKKQNPPTHRIRNQSPKAIEGILSTVGQQMGLSQKAQEWAVLSLWQQVIPPVFQESTEAVKIIQRGYQKQLLVKTKHAAVAAELVFYLESILAQINSYQAQTGIVVHQIIIR